MLITEMLLRWYEKKCSRNNLFSMCVVWLSLYIYMLVIVIEERVNMIFIFLSSYAIC